MRKGERLLKEEGSRKLSLGAARAGCCWGVWEAGKDAFLRVVPNEGWCRDAFPPNPHAPRLTAPSWHIPHGICSLPFV